MNGSKILLLGMSYKPNVGDIRESPCIEILKLLLQLGADVTYHDPHVPYLSEYRLSSVALNEDELQSADCIVIGTDHALLDLKLVVNANVRVVDLRNAVRRKLGVPLPDKVEVL